MQGCMQDAAVDAASDLSHALQVLLEAQKNSRFYFNP